MADIPFYTKSPITEAIIDLRVTTADEAPLSALEQFGTSQRADYPTRKMFNFVNGRLNFESENSTLAQSEPMGFAFISQDKKQIVRVHGNGFTFSRLAPYESWNAIRCEARRLWAAFRDEVKPTRISRIAVRYVNRLDLPGPSVELKDYLRVGPEVAPALTEPLAGFFLQLQIPQNDLRASVLLSEMLDEPRRPDCLSVILDLDLFREDMLPTSEEELWSVFDQLHLRMNRIFEACITDRTKELIR